MERKYPELNLKNKKKWKTPKPKNVIRFWGQAARFEQCHIKRRKSR